MTLNEAREIAAQAWCAPATACKIMDVELAEEFAKILVNEHNRNRGKLSVAHQHQIENAPDVTIWPRPVGWVSASDEEVKKTFRTVVKNIKKDADALEGDPDWCDECGRRTSNHTPTCPYGPVPLVPISVTPRPSFAELLAEPMVYEWIDEEVPYTKKDHDKILKAAQSNNTLLMPQPKQKPRPILVITYEAGNLKSLNDAKETASAIKEAGYENSIICMADDHDLLEVQGDADISGITVSTLDQEAVTAIREAKGERTTGAMLSNTFRCGCCNIKRDADAYTGGVWIKKDGKLDRHISVCDVCSVTAMKSGG